MSDRLHDLRPSDSIRIKAHSYESYLPKKDNHFPSQLQPLLNHPNIHSQHIYPTLSAQVLNFSVQGRVPLRILQILSVVTAGESILKWKCISGRLWNR
jgi:hypothetical protein